MCFRKADLLYSCSRTSPEYDYVFWSLFHLFHQNGYINTNSQMCSSQTQLCFSISCQSHTAVSNKKRFNKSAIVVSHPFAFRCQTASSFGWKEKKTVPANVCDPKGNDKLDFLFSAFAANCRIKRSGAINSLAWSHLLIRRSQHLLVDSRAI